MAISGIWGKGDGNQWNLGRRGKNGDKTGPSPLTRVTDVTLVCNKFVPYCCKAVFGLPPP